jgi:hypothetical protein
MAVVHDYKCPKHGFFEAREAVCPQGCKEGVKIVYLKAPSLMSPKTRRTDKTVKNLAKDFDMTNIKSTKEGESQTGYYTRKNKTKAEPAAAPREPRPGDAAIWGGGPRGLDMASILSGRAIRSVAGESVGINPKDVGNLTGPKAASYIADHENLTLKK